MNARAGFLPGMGVGAIVALAAMLLVTPAEGTGGNAGGLPDADVVAGWIMQNFGHSSWLFAAVLLLFLVHVGRLRRMLLTPDPDRHQVVELDQLTDVWIHLFIGIGVVWTAVGMRGALQSALADPDHALTDSAGSVLKNLVDGGILLALSTTILGAVGGYLMRLGKTLYTGAAMHAFYEQQHGGDVRELLATVQRLEQRLGSRTQVLDDAPG